jgi:hypothetical protein
MESKLALETMQWVNSLDLRGTRCRIPKAFPAVERSGHIDKSSQAAHSLLILLSYLSGSIAINCTFRICDFR